MAERDLKGVRSRRPFRRRRDHQNVVLISRDASLATLLEAMIARPRALRVLSSSSEFPDPPEFAADAVVLDLPYRVRWAAFLQVRERYSGRMIVTVSSERETEGWPPDPACWFLVRPFGAEDVARALQAPVPPGPAARAPLATRRRHGAGREAAPPRGAAEPQGRGSEAPPESAPRLSSDESLWDVDTGAPAPAVTAEAAAEPAVAKADRFRPSRRVLAEVVGTLVLVIAVGLGGIAIGRAGAPADRLDVRAIHPVVTTSPPSTTSPPLTSKVLASSASCLSALDHADAAISYLVANIRDDRLSRSIQQYETDRRTCRERVR